MNLIDRYIQEVSRKLPEKMREDISLELRSNLLDMLPEDYSVDDVKQELKKLGDPTVLAAQYKERPMHLIGPGLYNMYITVLKMVLGIAATVILIIFIIDSIVGTLASDTALLITIPRLFGEGIWILINVAIKVFTSVTIVFAILERTIGSTLDVPLTLSGKKWTPEDLENTPYIPDKKVITKVEIIFGFFWVLIWIPLYFNAADIINLSGVSKVIGLDSAIPVFNAATLVAYLPLALGLFIIEILRVTDKAMAKQWTSKLAIRNTVVHLASFLIIIILARNPNLLDEAFIPYMVNLVENPVESVKVAVDWIIWTIVVTVIVTGMIDIYNGFRKAKIK